MNPLTKTSDGIVLDFDWGQIEWLVSEAQGNSDLMTFGRVTIEAGKANPRHRHPNCDEILHLVSGKIRHTLGDETFLLNSGDTISIPTGVYHNAASLGPEAARMIICFSSADRQTEGE